MEDETSDSQDEPTMEGWNKVDKYNLFRALKLFGSHDIKHISKEIVNKNIHEIEKAIKYYKKKALKNPSLSKNKKKKTNYKISNSHIPLASWAKFLADSLNYDDLKTDTEQAIRLISEFESHPSSAYVGNVNLKKIYTIIANAMEGKTLPDDKLVAAVLEKCLTETAMTSKAFIRYNTYRHVLETINVAGKNENIFSKPTDNHEHINIRHLASQKSYNPLNIDIHYLKQT